MNQYPDEEHEYQCGIKREDCQQSKHLQIMESLKLLLNPLVQAIPAVILEMPVRPQEMHIPFLDDINKIVVNVNEHAANQHHESIIRIIL